jgi:hypothetical protein
VDAQSGLVGDEDRPVAFPTAGQTGVPTLFPNESPDPIPAAAPRPAGYPITLQFPMWDPEVSGVRAELTDAAGNRVPFHLSDPERPACDFPQMNTICLIPVRQLARSTTYRVRITAEVEGKAVSQDWSFTTEAGPAAASRRETASRGPVAAPRPVASAAGPAGARPDGSRSGGGSARGEIQGRPSIGRRAAGRGTARRAPAARPKPRHRRPSGPIRPAR